MLTSTNRELFLLQSKTNVRAVEKSAARAQGKAAASTVTSATMVFVDSDAAKVHMLDPCTLFGMPPHVAAKETQLHLGGKGINAIHPKTQLFVNLESIVLSDNKLARLEGLLPRPVAHPSVTTAPLGCTRVKRLYLTNNRLTTLKGDIEQLKYVEVLLLGNNLLSNMERVSKELQHLHYLKQLDLFGNPVCEEQSYRLYFIHRHPSLELLDRKSIAQEERDEAAAMFGRGAGAGGKKGAGLDSSASSVASLMGVSARRGDGPPSEHHNGADPSAASRGYAFGSSFVKGAATNAPARRIDELSASAALLEAKVRAILLKRSADEMRQQSKAQAALDEIAEQRQLFHTLWEWSGGFLKGHSRDEANAGQAAGGSGLPEGQKDAKAPRAGAKPTAAAVAAATSPSPGPVSSERLSVPATLSAATVRTTDPHQSSLFAEGGTKQHPHMERLLGLVRQLLNAEPERRTALAEELRQSLHLMIPERPGDGFCAALSEWKQQRLPTAAGQYLQRMARLLFTASELSSLQRMFSSDVASIDEASLPALVEALEDAATLKAGISLEALKRAFRAEFNLPNASNTPGAHTRKASLADRTNAPKQIAVTLDQALQLLVRYLPFASTRPAYYQTLSAKALKDGDADAARKYFQRSNEATDHQRLLERNATATEATSNSVSDRFVRLTTLPIT